MLRFWEKRAKRTGKRKISLGAAKKPTNVVGFYEKSGYSVVREKAKYVVMEKEI